jgi:small-conductance mechanosensitive channel
MELYKVQLIETVTVLALLFVVRLVSNYFVKLTIVKSYFKNAEKKDIIKLINLILYVITIIIISAIWSVKQENILLFASSLITVFGVALFAEMSILSNITACIILFFQHPIKVGDRISFTYEGKDIEGELIDISYFFVYVKTKKATLTVPNALLLKSSFSIEDPIEKTNSN